MYLLVSNTISISDNVRVLKRTWWRLFQKRVVCTKSDIYDFITYYLKNEFRFRKDKISISNRTYFDFEKNEILFRK